MMLAETVVLYRGLGISWTAWVAYAPVKASASRSRTSKTLL